jgi:hypothetical protein
MAKAACTESLCPREMNRSVAHPTQVGRAEEQVTTLAELPD